MTAKPRKPLLVNLTWAGVALLVALVFYVASFGAAAWMFGADWIVLESRTDLVLRHIVHRPLWWLMDEAEWSGEEVLDDYWVWCWGHGYDYRHQGPTAEPTP